MFGIFAASKIERHSEALLFGHTFLLHFEMIGRNDVGTEVRSCLLQLLLLNLSIIVLTA
jgi:hypothetical protein